MQITFENHESSNESSVFDGGIMIRITKNGDLSTHRLPEVLPAPDASKVIRESLRECQEFQGLFSAVSTKVEPSCGRGFGCS